MWAELRAYYAKMQSEFCQDGLELVSKALRPFKEPAVQAVFDGYPSGLRTDLLQLRDLIFDTARDIESVGELVETTKWGQPAYLPTRPNVGSTIRIDALKNETDRYAMFFHCQTTLVENFRELYPDEFAFRGNRALLFCHGEPVSQDALKHCIGLSLTYHLRSRDAAAKLKSR